MNRDDLNDDLSDLLNAGFTPAPKAEQKQPPQTEGKGGQPKQLPNVQGQEQQKRLPQQKQPPQQRAHRPPRPRMGNSQQLAVDYSLVCRTRTVCSAGAPNPANARQTNRSVK